MSFDASLSLTETDNIRFPCALWQELCVRLTSLFFFLSSNWFLFFFFHLRFISNCCFRYMPRYGWCYSLMSNNYDTLANQLHFFFIYFAIIEFYHWFLSHSSINFMGFSLPWAWLNWIWLCAVIRFKWKLNKKKNRNNNALNGFVMSTSLCAFVWGLF